MNGARPESNGKRMACDAIVMSGWNWETFNVPERLALALALAGARVLYCENPSSIFRRPAGTLAEVHRGVSRLATRFLGQRLNRVALGRGLQSKIVAHQVLQFASELDLRNPLLFYPHGDFFLPLCREFKKKGFLLIHGCMDYPEPGQDRHIELSDLTLTLSKTIFHQLKAKYGDKVRLIPQVRWFDPRAETRARGPLSEFSSIPRPRLGYIGPVSNRLNLEIVRSVLVAHPEWHFVHFGASKCLPLANVHVIAWRDPTRLAEVLSNLDVGFMPYDCQSDKNFHCMPLKVFDYFLEGLPVVSTPIVNLWEYSDAIYFGDDADELAGAIQMALQESPDNPRRSRRVAIGRANSIETLAHVLVKVLESCGKTAHAVAV